MAKTKAKKRRAKLVREGRRDPVLERGSWGSIKPVERKTPTLMELKQKMNTKHKKRYQPHHWDCDDTFSCFI